MGEVEQYCGVEKGRKGEPLNQFDPSGISHE
jgi:hypothetical protein